MSQVSIIDITGSQPQIPTQFDANVGFAIPLANVLEIFSDVSAAGSIPTQTIGVGNNITTYIQTSQAIAATDATKIGLSAFDSASFAVDANGFVTLTGGGAAFTDIMVDAFTPPGTNPVVPNAGVITITGAQVIAGTVGANVIRTNSTSANSFAIEIQRSAAIGAPDTTKNGVVHFDSSSFVVDGSGFVTLVGGSAAIDSIGTQTGTNPIVPTAAGLVTINGAVVASGTNPVRSHGTAANTMALEVQISQALAATDATKIGLCNFDSSKFTVDANGFVSTSGTGIAQTITGDSGGALSPTAGNWNLLGSGSITTSGAGSTLTTQLTGLTNHAVLVGAGTSTITKVGPTATAGQVLQSAGAAADPAFSTATYPSTTTISQILYSSAANVVSGLATANSAVLVTNSTGVPVWSSTMTNGQLIIGSTGATPSAATLTSGTGISITNGAASITINATGGGFTWTDVTGTSQTAAINNGYTTNNAGLVTVTLPSTAAYGSIVWIVGKGAGGWRIAQPNAGSVIHYGNQNTTTGVTGRLDSSNRYDAIQLLCTVANDEWTCTGISQGNITVT